MSALTRYGLTQDDDFGYNIDACEDGEYVRAEEHLAIVAGLAAALRFVAENSHEIVSRDVARRALAKAGAA